MECAQSVYPLARHPHHRRSAHLCGNGLCRRVGRAGDVPTRSTRRPHRGRRRAARLLQQGWPALGQSALRLRRDGPRRLWLVDPARRRGAEALRRAAHRPFPRLGKLLGRAPRREDRKKRPLGQGARHGACRRADQLVPRPRLYRRGPRRAVARRHTATQGLRSSRYEGAGICLRLARHEQLSAAQLRGELHLLHRHARQRAPRPLVRGGRSGGARVCEKIPRSE